MALTKTYTRKEFEEYAKANPMENIRVVKGPTGVSDVGKYVSELQNLGVQEAEAKQRSQRGFLGNIIAGLGEELTAAPRALIAGLDPRTSKSILTLSEQQRFRADPTAFGLQSIARTGSFAVPGGSLGRLALAGGLSAFGNTDLRNADLATIAGNVAGGAIGGAVIGKGLQTAGKGISRLGGQRIATGAAEVAPGGLKGLVQPLGRTTAEAAPSRVSQLAQNLRGGSFAMDIAEAGSPQAARGLRNEAINIVSRNTGRAPSTAMQVAEGVEVARRQLGSEFGKEVANIPARLSGNNLVAKIGDTVDQLARPDLLDNPVTSSYITRLQRLGDNASPKQISDLVFELQDQLTGVYNKAATTGDTAMTATQQGLKLIRDNLSNELKSLPGSQRYSQILDELSNIHKVQDATNISAQQMTRQGLTAFGQRLPLPGEQITGRLKSGLAGVLENVAGKQVGTRAGVVQGAKGILANVGNFIQNPNIVRSAVILSNVNKSDLPPETKQAVTDSLVSGEELPDYAAPLFMDTDQTQQQRTSVLQQLLARGMKMSDAAAYVNFVLPPMPKLSAADRKMLSSTLTARKNLDDLKKLVQEYSSYFNPITGQPIFTQLATFTGDVGRAKLNTALSGTMQQILKNLEGGKMTDRDREYYNINTAPSLTDTPERALAKLEEIERLIKNDEDTARSLLGTQGLNINMMQ